VDRSGGEGRGCAKRFDEAKKKKNERAPLREAGLADDAKSQKR
jgi:hypothetical protein